ncbi:cytochrome c oxidase subunit 3 [Phenylobacterium sp.]|uniref:cytochrome c oxidase subunit 3 n=1 Tax=Phenylobacterium sp. TaxID=1871053 RepID=UPI004036AD17
MAQAGVKHDYHLVNPSPWPLVASVGATVMAVGLVMWLKGLFGMPAGTWWLFAAGLTLVLITMAGWWIDVTKEANAGDHTPVVSLGLRYGMILFIASEVMFFVAWFWIFFEMALFHEARTLSSIEEVRQAWATWPPAGIETVPAWNLPLVNTLTLLLSGTTVTWAHHALQQGDRKGAQFALILTVILGVIFSAIQAYEYHHILSHEYFYNDAAISSGLYGSSFFMATGFHGAHVVIGTIFLAVCLYRVYLGHFKPAQHLGFEFAAWYWHFVDVVWLFLFAFIYVVFGGAGH